MLENENNELVEMQPMTRLLFMYATDRNLWRMIGRIKYFLNKKNRKKIEPTFVI